MRRRIGVAVVCQGSRRFQGSDGALGLIVSGVINVDVVSKFLLTARLRRRHSVSWLPLPFTFRGLVRFDGDDQSDETHDKHGSHHAHDDEQVQVWW